uniref:Uncharacterized protein n=1 Tax=Arion vulgaris TaxID=1028688 RepID=A0A0B7AB75_9EUPU
MYELQRRRNIRPSMSERWTGKLTNSFLWKLHWSLFTKTFKNDPRKVGRGCTQSQYGVPYPLPPSGCYTYSDETWCICSTPGCNGGPIDISSGVEFDEHLNVLENVVELDGINRCYQCLSFSDGVYYPQCPRNSRVKNAFLAPCNGTCFTRTYDKDERVISRGCTTSQWGLPNPLPPDGCYTWYTEIWCLCSTSRCNGAALGIPQNREIDDHLKKTPGGQRSVKDNIDMFVLPFLAITCILKMFFHV